MKVFDERDVAHNSEKTCTYLTDDIKNSTEYRAAYEHALSVISAEDQTIADIVGTPNADPHMVIDQLMTLLPTLSEGGQRDAARHIANLSDDRRRMVVTPTARGRALHVRSPAVAQEKLVAVVREMGIDPERVNVNGGAIALGHPLGMTGARLATTAMYQLLVTQGRYALCTMCIGVGQGISLIIERV